MATLPGKTGPGSNVAKVPTSNVSPEIAALLGDPKFEQFLKAMGKAYQSYNSGGRNNPAMGAVSTNMQTGEERMIMPPSQGRPPLPKEVMYKGRPKKGGGTALGQSLAEQEMIYDSQGDLSETAQLGPGVPVPPPGAQVNEMGPALIRAMATNSPEGGKTLAKAREKGLVTPRNVPLGMEDYDLNQGRGGQVQGVDTVAGTEQVEQDMAAAVQEFETTGRMPDGSNQTVLDFIRLYGKDHPLYKRMQEVAGGGAATGTQ